MFDLRHLRSQIAFVQVMSVPHLLGLEVTNRHFD